MVIIKHLQMNRNSALNSPKGVDMPINKLTNRTAGFIPYKTNLY